MFILTQYSFIRMLHVTNAPFSVSVIIWIIASHWPSFILPRNLYSVRNFLFFILRHVTHVDLFWWCNSRLFQKLYVPRDILDLNWYRNSKNIYRLHQTEELGLMISIISKCFISPDHACFVCCLCPVNFYFFSFLWIFF